MDYKKVAIVHDWLVSMRGGEYVLEAILDVFPDADVFTLFYEKSNISNKINSHKIYTSSLNKNIFKRKYYRYLLHKMPLEIEKFDLSSYDLVVSSSHCVAKGVITPPDSIHIGYIHTPMRYIWDQYHNYFGEAKFLKKKFIDKKLHYLRLWDVASSSRVDYFIANSNFVKERIKKYYKREAEVIHPPVDTDFFTPDNSKMDKNYFIYIGALVPYKRVDILIEAFNSINENLVIVGKGSEEKRLKKIASSNIKFLKDVEREVLRELLRGARAFVYSGVEDFGISFVEAQAVGVPVIAYGKGGIKDIVKEEKTGILFYRQDSKAILEAIDKFYEIDFKVEEIRESAMKFSKKVFLDKFKGFVSKLP